MSTSALCDSLRSHPARGEWIEISVVPSVYSLGTMSHPARGEWIEMIKSGESGENARCLTPRGVSGLK